MFGGYQATRRMLKEIERIDEEHKPPAPPKTGSKFHSPLAAPNFADSQGPEIEAEWLRRIGGVEDSIRKVQAKSREGEAERLSVLVDELIASKQRQGREANCPNCGAPVRLDLAACPYCDTPYVLVAHSANPMKQVETTPLPIKYYDKQEKCWKYTTEY